MGLIHRERERDGRTAKTRVKFEMVYAQIDNILFETVYIMRSFGSASEKILLFLFYSSAATLRIWVCTLEIAMIVTKNDGIEWIFSTVITILKWEKDHEFEPIVCVYREREICGCGFYRFLPLRKSNLQQFLFVFKRIPLFMPFLSSKVAFGIQFISLSLFSLTFWCFYVYIKITGDCALNRWMWR